MSVDDWTSKCKKSHLKNVSCFLHYDSFSESTSNSKIRGLFHKSILELRSIFKRPKFVIRFSP